MSIAQHIILPGTESDLLRRELALGFAALGCRVSRLRPDEPGGLAALAASPKTLLFSVNFQGLFPLRERLALLGASAARAAVWLVDNPWNILSGVRDPRWKSLPIFVTDASFIKPLRAHGAEFVRHLPLAAAFELFAPNEERDAAYAPPKDAAPLCFVGRSAFPGKETFFAGQQLPEGILAEAKALLKAGQRPNLTWWEDKLKLTGALFWPGKKARLAALGAENSNLAYRSQCLAAACAAGACLAGAAAPALDIYGDDGWRALLPAGARLYPPVDYYARLPGIYAAHRYSLCLTSLQLPCGLNQRHFDIWAAGGFALSDDTPGLDIFPGDLTRPIRFGKAPGLPALPELVANLEKNNARGDLQRQWRECLKNGHSYAHRAASVLEALDALDAKNQH
ncbi:DUF3880 domain-containing protein [Desulfovibrio sp. OttesenSCG-928-M14]|nr:DUF3880 domain-containing protein [Desulfovibrio sp. OttesenSCG-928-M14]